MLRSNFDGPIDPPEPDWETEEEHFCLHCDRVTTHAVVGYQGRAWQTCEECLHEDVVTVEAEGPDDRRQEDIENYRENNDYDQT